MEYFNKFVHFALYFNAHKQPITHDYPWLPIIVCPLYILFVYYGPKYMEKREPFELKGLLALWNLFLFILSLFMFLGMIGPCIAFLSERTFYDLVCMPQGELYYGFAFFCVWCFALSKYIELGDTVFIILRKRKLSFLHYYHHTTVLVYTWFSMVILTPPGAIFAVVNAGVHCVMYWYYFLSARGYKLTWGKFVTIIQLSQMVVGVSISSIWSYYYLSGTYCPMDHPNLYMASSLIIYGSYFALFLNFYINRYHYMQEYRDYKNRHNVPEEKQEKQEKADTSTTKQETKKLK
eukprot:TRINITY_DN93833_c0_g1_i1.p1 TRINITY_DN93833_c0_g1~~TRINITY_DN93833_c0_g1_i1.p1  ORF type:complete len:292 (-),score=30.00 TRINITY_DN93833_c0_g1_i1:16-891(-)